MDFIGLCQDKNNLFREIKQFKKKKNQNRYSFKTQKVLKQINLDNTVLSESTNLIEENQTEQIPNSLLFYKDLNVLRSSFNVSIMKAKNLMKKKLRSTWGSSSSLDVKIDAALDECQQHVKIFEKTLKKIQKPKQSSIYAKMIESMINNFQIKLKEMILILKKQEQKYFAKLKGLDSNSKVSSFDFINDEEDNQFDSEKFIYDEQGKIMMIKEIKQDDRQDLIKMVQKIDTLTQMLSQMNDMTMQQGALVDRIDYNIEETLEKTKKANEELFQAKEDLEKGCAAKILRFLVIANVFLFLINVLRNWF